MGLRHRSHPELKTQPDIPVNPVGMCCADSPVDFFPGHAPALKPLVAAKPSVWSSAQSTACGSGKARKYTRGHIQIRLMQELERAIPTYAALQLPSAE
jgi:hypothetical protein